MCREVCFLKMLNASKNAEFRIGGEGTTVEVDEAKFGKRKYHRGRHVEGVWVFGAIQRETETTTRRMFMCTVPDRTAATLIEIIKKWIKPRIHIIL